MQEQKKENVSLEYALVELAEQFKKQVCDLKNKYSEEKRKLISVRLNSMASYLRERSEAVLLSEFEDAPSEIEEKLKDANMFITIYNNLCHERLDEVTRKQVEKKYKEAIEKQKAYKSLLEFKAKTGEEKEAGILIIKSGDCSYLYPTMFYEDMEKAPSLMLNLLEYCLVSCENTKIPVEMPEKDNVYLRIKLKTQARRDQNRLLRLLNSAEPDGFKKANLKFIVLREEDYDLEKPEKLREIPKRAQKHIQKQGEKIFTAEDVAEELGIALSSANYRIMRYFGKHGKKYKKGKELGLTVKQFGEITSKKSAASLYREDVIKGIKTGLTDEEIREQIKSKYNLEKVGVVQGTINIYRAKHSRELI